MKSRRYKSLIPKPVESEPSPRLPAPSGGGRKRAAKIEGSARHFADLLAAFMTFSAEELADFE